MNWVSDGSGLSWGHCDSLEFSRDTTKRMYLLTSMSINKPISLSIYLSIFRFILRSLWTVYFKTHMMVKAGESQISRVGWQAWQDLYFKRWDFPYHTHARGDPTAGASKALSSRIPAEEAGKDTLGRNEVLPWGTCKLELSSPSRCG